MCISGFSKLTFHLLRGRVSGENCHFRLRSTTSGPHFDPTRYSFIASYDAKNELQREVINVIGIGYLILISLDFCDFIFPFSFLFKFWWRRYIKHERQCLTTFPNSSECVKNTPRHALFSTLFSVFGHVWSNVWFLV